MTFEHCHTISSCERNFNFFLGREGEECDNFLPQCISSFARSKLHLFIFFISQLDYSGEVYCFLLDYISLLRCVSNPDILSKIQC